LKKNINYKILFTTCESKAKEYQEDNREDSSTSSSFSIDILQENNNMAGRKHHLL